MYNSYRTKPLNQDKLNGQHIIVDNVITETSKILNDYASLGYFGHEGLVFWCGRRFEDLSIITSVCAPKTDSGPQSVFVDGADLAKCSKKFREFHTSILYQIHTHPSVGTIHSDGDDDLIILPFEGMLSIVIPNYGKGFYDLSESSIHQFQNNEWVLCLKESVQENLTIVPSIIDLRYG